MDCRFCKLEDIVHEEGLSYKCQYCGYSFSVSKMGVFYDNMMKMPLSSWLLASILWFSAMLTGVLFGLGFTSSSLQTTILFLFIYGGSAFLYGGSVSIDFFETMGKYLLKLISGKKPNFEEVKKEIQVSRKEKIVKEMSQGLAAEVGTKKHIVTDIRPGEKKIPKIASSFLAGLWTILLGTFFVIIFSNVFPTIR